MAAMADGTTVRTEVVAGTRELILTTAERLFAEHGVHAVSDRQVSEAAGQGDNAAVGYHFGTKADLVRAIARKHAERVEGNRVRLLAEIGDSTAVRDWVSCPVRPNTEHLAALGGPTWHARFCAQVMTDPALHRIMVEESLGSPSPRRLVDGLWRCLPRLPDEVRAERASMARRLILHTCAERERALAENTRTPRASWHDAATGLVDVIVGLSRTPVTCPPTRTTRPYERRSGEPMSLTPNAVDRLPTAIALFMMPRAAACPFDPPPRLRTEQQERPLTRVRLWDGSNPWLVTRYADQRTLLLDPRVSADVTGPGCPGQIAFTGENTASCILMDDPEQARLRRMVTAPFAIKRMDALRPAVQKIVDNLIDDLLAGPDPVDLVQAFALPVPALVICELLGVPYGDHDFFQENSSTLIRRDASTEERMVAGARLIEYLDSLLGTKAANPAQDLLSGLVARIESGELTSSEAARMGVLLLAADHETTAHMIALGTLALLEHPDQLALLRDTDDPELVVSAVEELLRYLNIPHDGRRRVALEDIDDAHGGTPVVLDLLDRPLGARPVLVRHRALGTREGELQRGGPSDPGPRPGDDDTAPLKADAVHGVLLGSARVGRGRPEVGERVRPRTRRRSGGVAGDRVRDGADPRPHGFGAGAAFCSRRPRLW